MLLKKVHLADRPCLDTRHSNPEDRHFEANIFVSIEIISKKQELVASGKREQRTLSISPFLVLIPSTFYTK